KAQETSLVDGRNCVWICCVCHRVYTYCHQQPSSSFHTQNSTATRASRAGPGGGLGAVGICLQRHRVFHRLCEPARQIRTCLRMLRLALPTRQLSGTYSDFLLVGTPAPQRDDCLSCPSSFE